MSFELGRTYSGYEFLDQVGKTGTTVAYRVRNTMAHREELLYVLSEQAQDDPRRRDRFMREMGLRARLQHPNIPAFLNATGLNGHLVMMTEPVQGRTLAQALQKGPLPWRDVVALARQILSALACAHEFNIIHRGISTESISITDEGTVELSNFELAKGVSSPQLTQAGAIFGNAGYISPEQARGTGELDSRSDIYSVGAVLYHALAGRPPFRAASEFELMLAHVKETPSPPGSFDASVPAALDSIVLKALSKDPARRYATCAEFAEALEGASAADEAPRTEEAPSRAVRPSSSLLGALRERLRSFWPRPGSSPVEDRAVRRL
jgi:serine/threonine protein kinase